MTALKVVGMYIAFDSRSRFPDVGILCKIGFLIFEATKPTFNHDVDCPAAFSTYGEVLWRPVDRRENYVKRCVGLPGTVFSRFCARVSVCGVSPES